MVAISRGRGEGCGGMCAFWGVRERSRWDGGWGPVGDSMAARLSGRSMARALKAWTGWFQRKSWVSEAGEDEEVVCLAFAAGVNFAASPRIMSGSPLRMFWAISYWPQMQGTPLHKHCLQVLILLDIVMAQQMPCASCRCNFPSQLQLKWVELIGPMHLARLPEYGLRRCPVTDAIWLSHNY